jgi:hypothetical protein
MSHILVVVLVVLGNIAYFVNRGRSHTGTNTATRCILKRILHTAIYTILYKENPWYRFAESVFRLAVGYQVALD